MTCKACKKRDKCITLCSYMEKYLSKFEAYRDELPVSDEILEPLFDKYLEERTAPYFDRHSAFLPELKHRMMNLTRKQKKIIRLHFFYELSQAEIARRLNLNPSTVMRDLDLAIEKLKRPVVRKSPKLKKKFVTKPEKKKQKNAIISRTSRGTRR